MQVDNKLIYIGRLLDNSLWDNLKINNVYIMEFDMGNYIILEGYNQVYDIKWFKQLYEYRNDKIDEICK